MTLIEDRFRAGLADDGWAVEPPADPAGWVQSRVRGQRKRRAVAAPVVVALATAAVASGVSLTRPAPVHEVAVTTVAAAIGYEEALAAKPEDGAIITPRPKQGEPWGNDAEPCSAGSFTATLAVTGSTGELELSPPAPRGSVCALPGAAPVLVGSSGGTSTRLDTAYPQQPDVPNPPIRPDGVIGYDGLHAPVRWTSFCGPRDSTFALHGLAEWPVPVTVTGQLPRCAGDAPVVVDRLRRKDDAHAIVPVDRQRLRITVDLPPTAQPGSNHRYTVHIANPSTQPVSLRPCAVAVEELEFEPLTAGGSGTARSEPLPCALLPERLEPGEEVTLEQQTSFREPGEARGRDSVRFRWSIAGAAPYEAEVRLGSG